MRRTVKVRIAVAVASGGDYIAYGLGGISRDSLAYELFKLRDGWAGDDGQKVVVVRYVTTSVPVPDGLFAPRAPRQARKAKGAR